MFLFVPHSKKGKYDCGKMDVVIQKNTIYPTQSTPVMYCQKNATSSVANLDLYEGNSMEVKENYHVGTIHISGVPPRHPGRCDSIKVEINLDVNGILNISATSNGTEFEKALSVATKDGNLDDTEVALQRNEMKTWFTWRHINQALSPEY